MMDANKTRKTNLNNFRHTCTKKNKILKFQLQCHHKFGGLQVKEMCVANLERFLCTRSPIVFIWLCFCKQHIEWHI